MSPRSSETAAAATTTIHLLRHAKTTWGEESRYAGHTDVPLSEKGRRDCERAAQALEGLQVDAVVTSHLSRAQETARLVLPGCQPIADDGMIERSYGVLEGRKFSEAKDVPMLWIEVGGDTHSVNPPGAEPFEDVWFRVKDFSKRLLRAYAGRSVLVVGHSTSLQMLAGVLTGGTCIDSLAWAPRNLELVTIELGDGEPRRTHRELMAEHEDVVF